MANVQSNKASSSNKRKNNTGASASASATKAKTSTGERDQTYHLISLLYHSLQGAETASQSIEDAGHSGDEELVQFFESVRAEYAERASEARRLLAERIGDEDDEDDALSEDEDDEDEDDEE